MDAGKASGPDRVGDRQTPPGGQVQLDGPGAGFQLCGCEQGEGNGVDNEPEGLQVGVPRFRRAVAQGQKHGTVGGIPGGNGHVGSQTFQKPGKTLSDSSPAQDQGGGLREGDGEQGSGDLNGAVGCDRGVSG